MEISVTTPAEAERAGSAIMLAFGTDPMARWSHAEPGRSLAAR